MIKRYLDEIHRMLDKVYNEQLENMEMAAHMIVDAAVEHKSIFAFGCSHAGILAQELFYRTGGLAIINPILAPGLTLDVKPVTLTSSIERMDGYGKVLADSIGFKNGDVLIIHSVSGRNNVSVDMAVRARELGVKVIALTNLEYSSNSPSRHPSGKRLFEVCDLVIDNCGCFGDAALDVPGMPEKVAPTSTVIGAAILDAIVAETVKIFMEKGVIPPVFVSANVDGGDEHNKRMLDEYKENIRYM